MNRTFFPLFLSHLDFAHHFWTDLLRKGDAVIDATCGNGYDALKLSRLVLSEEAGRVFCFDYQEDAITSTRQLLHAKIAPSLYSKIYFEKRCHSEFPQIIQTESIKLIVYNLGYLPGGDKTITTQTSTTLRSIDRAMHLLQPSGVISITCYPGHSEGEIEQEAILDFAATLCPKKWSCSHHSWINRQQSPNVFFLQKS